MTYNEALVLFGFTAAPNDEVLEKQYKKLMRKWHPDFSQEANATEMSMKVNEAYEVIKKGANCAKTVQEPKLHRYTHESIFRIVLTN